MKEIILKTPSGSLRGFESEDNIQKYLGIRYAHAERWEYPKEVKKWEGIYDASCFKDACIQTRTFRKEEDTSFYYREFRKGEAYTYSEDCFYLNIWKPDSCQNAPVILYIHGGAFQGGCGNEKHLDGTQYAKRGIIFITCNYRLGPFGFCSLAELAERDGHTGNYGLYDQLAALEWVCHNIAAFGGDPDHITLMGQSAGAMSIQQLCASPLVKDKISRAVMTSGGGISREFGTCLPVKETYPFWHSVVAKLGNSLCDWLKADAGKLLEVMHEEAQNHPNAIANFSPVLDGVLITHDAESIRSSKCQADIPYLMGSTKDDMALGIIDRMAKEWAVLQTTQSLQPSYCFSFNRNLPGDDEGAWHSSELWYTLGMLTRSWRPMTSWDSQISDTLITYITNFAATGNPNGADLPPWFPTKTMDDAILIIDDNSIEMK